MQYMLLIYEPEAMREKGSPEDGRKMMAEYGEFTTDIQKSGHFKAGDALHGVKTATTVRVRDGKVQRTDGPFAETKEQLAGFYLIEARDLNEAIRVAAKIPPGRLGCVEVRPVWQYERSEP